MIYNIVVFVDLKDGVLDTAGKAVSKSLKNLGLSHQERSVRIGKTIKLLIEAENDAQVEKQVITMCETLFANPVIEQYRYEITKEA